MQATTVLEPHVSSPPMGLVERDVQLAALGSWLEEAASGEGRLVFVGGEAGAGKSALVGEFCRSLPADVPVYLGACEPLSAPRPLGPLADIAPNLDREIVERIARRRSQWCLRCDLAGALRWPGPEGDGHRGRSLGG